MSALAGVPAARTAGRSRAYDSVARVHDGTASHLTLARLALAACLTAGLTATSLRPWGSGYLALVAFVPAFVAIVSAKRALHGAGLAALAALGVNSVAYEAATVLFPGSYVLTLIAASVPYLAVGACAVRLRKAVSGRSCGLDVRRRPTPEPHAGRTASILGLLALPVLWAAAEWVPAQPGLLGVWALPLGFIGYSQVGLPTAVVARIGSVAAVSMLVLWINAGLALTYVALGRRAALTLAMLTVGGLALGTQWSGTTTGATPSEAAGATSGATSAVGASGAPNALTVRLVQPDLPVSAYLAARSSAATRSALRHQLGDALAGASAELVVLPEASWPGPIDVREMGPEIDAIGSAFGPHTVMFGAPAKGLGSPEKVRNSVFLYRPRALDHVYAKRRLVPVAEGGLLAGTGPGVVEVAGVRVAPLVCYDALFPGETRSAAAGGAQVLVLVTDDSFAARADIPELHLRAARMRAIESGLPVVVAANTGPSAVVSPSGEVTARLDKGGPGVLDASVSPANSITPYSRHGDWLGGLNAATAGSLVLTASRGGRFKKRPT